jgi:putative FmdB family regulatory protein
VPIYEYRCLACERVTEALQRVDEAPWTTCPHCGGELRKLVSAPAFQFKGSGWYVSDYAGKSRPKQGGESGGGESKPAAGAAAASGADAAKPASKTETQAAPSAPSAAPGGADKD